MVRRWILACGIWIGCLAHVATAVPDRAAPEMPAEVSVRVVVPNTVETFVNGRLEVTLFAYDPRDARTEMQVGIQSVKPFVHNRGAETNINVELKGNISVAPNLTYYVTAAVVTPAGKRTHLGEINGSPGLPRVLTDSHPRHARLVMRESRPRDVVLEIAEEIKKGNNGKATRLAQVRAKDFEELFDLEDLYRRRNKGGMGWGTTPAKNMVADGLEVKLQTLTRVVPADFLLDAKNNEEAAYWLAAMAELVMVKQEFKPAGKKTKVDWEKKAGKLRVDVDQLGKAIAAKNVAAVQGAAKAIVQACNECHLIYRD